MRICCVHWGRENIYYPSPQQREIAAFLEDKGFDLILGNHSHLPQKTEKLKRAIVTYSHGNFIFDSFIYDPPGVFAFGEDGLRKEKLDVNNITYDLPCPLKKRTIKKWRRKHRESLILEMNISYKGKKPVLKYKERFVLYDDSAQKVRFLDERRHKYLKKIIYKPVNYDEELQKWKKENLKRQIRQILFLYSFPISFIRIINAYLNQFQLFLRFKKVIKKGFFFDNNKGDQL